VNVLRKILSRIEIVKGNQMSFSLHSLRTLGYTRKYIKFAFIGDSWGFCEKNSKSDPENV
jgi:hypothetical protein